MKTIRSYKRLVNEIINLQIPFRVEIIGYVNYYEEIYPLLAMKHISKMAQKNIVIFGGHHGDEHYAVHILLKWIQQFKPESFTAFNFHIFPVVNPFGYSTGRRDNGSRQDTNNANSFIKNSTVKELAILFDNAPFNVDFCIDIHGDTGKKNVYAYERKLENLFSIAEKALIENDKILSYERSKTIYKEKVSNGVISTPACDEGIEASMEKLGTEYTVTIELPGKCNAQKRTVGGIAIINSLLKNFQEIK